MANENTIQMLETDIEKAKNCLGNGDNEEICNLFDLLYGKYKNHILPIKALTKEIYSEKYETYYMPLLIERLELLLANLKDEKNENQPSNINNININNENSNTANSTINQNFDFKTTIENINKIPNEILDEKLKTELLGILTEIEHADEKESKKEKFKKILKWFGEKSADAWFNKFVDYIPNILSCLSKITF